MAIVEQRNRYCYNDVWSFWEHY